jgi:hypothetical protein
MVKNAADCTAEECIQSSMQSDRVKFAEAGVFSVSDSFRNRAERQSPTAARVHLRTEGSIYGEYFEFNTAVPQKGQSCGTRTVSGR